MEQIKAISFDFYLTLAHSRAGEGRGVRYHEYLSSQGLSADPWEHRILYETFPYYAEAYHPIMSPEDKQRFWTEFTRRLFAVTHVTADGATDAVRHAERIGEIFGSQSLVLYEDTLDVLNALRGRGFRLGIVSNWPAGLAYFCQELGLTDFMEFILVSAEFGCEKPDRRIFDESARRFGLPADRVLHVGDDSREDIQGALDAGLPAIQIARNGKTKRGNALLIDSLRRLLPLLLQPRPSEEE